MTESLPDFTWLPDLALRSLGGAVIWANDDVFAEKENLISPGPSAYRPASFGHKGQVYDGWETRRRRDAGHDTTIVRLGVPGVIRGVVVDTAWFKGNYPPAVSVDAIEVDGYPTAEQLAVDDRAVEAALGWPLFQNITLSAKDFSLCARAPVSSSTT